MAEQHMAEPQMAGLLSVDWLPELGLDFTRALATPLRVQSLALLRNAAGVHMLRLRTDCGREALYPAQERVVQVASFVHQVLAPAVQAQDLRELPQLLERFHRKHYKIVGLPFWASVGSFELLALDVLGRAAGQPVVELLGGVKSRRRFEIYLSSRDRVNTPEEEVAMFQRRLAATGARAIKLGIGGRMSRNADAWPGRSEALVAHARRTLGDGITIYADANGSYDARTAVEVGAMLRHHGVAMFEEPCPYDDFEMTAQVAAALDGIAIGWGESDHSLALFRWVCQHRAVDVLQPDLLWAGGILRTLQIARLAEAAGLPIVPHSPRAGMEQSPVLHLLAAIANPGRFHEFKALEHVPRWDCDVELAPDAEGTLTLPAGPGFGTAIVPASLGTLVPA
jgi:D-galactarolactone cycloisomerase